MRLLSAAVAASLLLLGGCGDDDSDSGMATIASGEQLQQLAQEAGHTVYWAGERPDTRTEYEQTEDGNVSIRYLPPEGDAEDARNSSLTVGSYLIGDAVNGLREVAEQPGANTFDIPGVKGAVVVSNEATPSSVYIAFPGSDVQVEVYDPDAANALEVALSGEIVPLN